MKIAQISNVSMRPFKGNLYLNGITTNQFLSDDDCDPVSEIRKMIKDEPYDINLTRDRLGQFHASVIHNNGKSVNLEPKSFPDIAISVPRYIKEIIALININKKERTN